MLLLKINFDIIEKTSNIIEMNCIQMHLMPTFNSQLPAFGVVLYQGRALEHSHLTPYFVLGAYTGKLFYNTKSVKVSFYNGRAKKAVILLILLLPRNFRIKRNEI